VLWHLKILLVNSRLSQPLTTIVNGILVDSSVELRFHVPLDTKKFGDVLPSQSLGLVLKKLNLTEQKQTTPEQNGKKH